MTSPAQPCAWTTSSGQTFGVLAEAVGVLPDVNLFRMCKSWSVVYNCMVCGRRLMICHMNKEVSFYAAVLMLTSGILLLTQY
jgi:hypothetical protein